MAARTSSVAPAPPADELAEAARRARSGEPAGFRALVELTSARLFRVAAHLLGDRDEAADVVQDAYVRAWSRIRELREPDAAIGWLVGIARNAARDRLRARRRRGLVPDGDERVAERPADPAGRPDHELAAAQLAAAVRRALAGLSEEHRLVLLLREVDGMSYDELTAVLSIKAGTVESRLHRARAKLARRLEQMRRAGELP